MADEILGIVSAIIIGILVFTLGYRLLSVSINQAHYESTIQNFNKLYSNIQSVCQQEIGSRTIIRFQVPIVVRVIYFTDDNTNALPAVTNLIENSQQSQGKYLCMQFKKEQDIRCEKLSCNGVMPYIGALEEYNDLQLMVNKILGKPLIKEYFLNIEKNINKDITVTVS
ncbi:MAG: hypothetical protein QXM68_00480 [Candidatus Aenigmatarchaeota archaeon]|nr:hypothetical protein [Candidatus Aenigmarchaeota archaeon]